MADQIKTTETVEGDEVVIRAAEAIIHPETGETIEVGEEISRHSVELIKYT